MKGIKYLALALMVGGCSPYTHLSKENRDKLSNAICIQGPVKNKEILYEFDGNTRRLIVTDSAKGIRNVYTDVNNDFRNDLFYSNDTLHPYHTNFLTQIKHQREFKKILKSIVRKIEN